MGIAGPHQLNKRPKLQPAQTNKQTNKRKTLSFLACDWVAQIREDKGSYLETLVNDAKT